MHAEAQPALVLTPQVYKTLRAQANACRVPAKKWDLLQAAHIVGQRYFLPHMETHFMMLRLAWQTRNWHEVFGQLFRLSLVPLGHALARLPAGNPGTAEVSAFASQPIPPHLRAIILRATPMETGRSA